MQDNLNPASANMKRLSTNVESPVKPAYAPEISPEMAAKNLGSKFPYSGGAMATHKPTAMAKGTHSYGGTPGAMLPAGGSGMESAHIIHAPRTT